MIEVRPNRSGAARNLSRAVYVLVVVVQPDRPEGTPVRGNVSRLGVLAAIGLAGVGLFVLARLTTADPQATDTTAQFDRPSTTAPFSVSQIEQGNPLQFELSASIGNRRVIATTNQGERVYLFTAPDHLTNFHGEGLETWVWEPGAAWELQGTGIGPEYQVRKVIPTIDGWLAAGTGIGAENQVRTIFTYDGWLAAGTDPAWSTVHVWTSMNGLIWEGADLTQPDHPLDVWRISILDMGGDRFLVATGSPRGDDRVWRILDEAFDEEQYGYSVHPRVGVVLNVPLGMPISVRPPEDFGLTRDDLESATSGFAPPYSVVWRSEDRLSWERINLGEEVYVDELYTGPDGRPWAMGDGNVVVFDGDTWVLAGTGERALRGIQPWRDGYVAVGFAPTGGWGILRSGDLKEWESLVPSDLFATLQWELYPVTVHGSLLAAVAETIEFVSPQVSVERDGYLLTVSDSEVVVGREGQIRTRIVRHSSTPTNHLDVDAQEERVTFLDTETGDPLVTFGFDELTALGNRLWWKPSGGQHRVLMPPLDDRLWRKPSGGQHRALVVTDGTRWTVQDLGPMVGDDGLVSTVHLAPGHLVLTVMRDPQPLLGPGEPTLEIWTAPVRAP